LGEDFHSLTVNSLAHRLHENGSFVGWKDVFEPGRQRKAGSSCLSTGASSGKATQLAVDQRVSFDDQLHAQNDMVSGSRIQILEAR
jgi:hypothetical protein